MSSELFTEYADVDDVLVYKIITPASYLNRCSANFSIQSNHDVVRYWILSVHGESEKLEGRHGEAEKCSKSDQI